MITGIYITNVTEGLKQLASYDFQKAAWLENPYNVISWFGDDVAAIYEDTSLGTLLYNGKDVVFSKEADQALRELEAACDAIGYEDGNDQYRRRLLDSDEMKIVRAMARRCLDLIRARDETESTVEIVEIPDLLTVDSSLFPDMPD